MEAWRLWNGMSERAACCEFDWQWGRIMRFVTIDYMLHCKCTTPTQGMKKPSLCSPLSTINTFITNHWLGFWGFFPLFWQNQRMKDAAVFSFQVGWYISRLAIPKEVDIIQPTWLYVCHWSPKANFLSIELGLEETYFSLFSFTDKNSNWIG